MFLLIFLTHVFVSCWKSCQSTSYICTQHVHLHTFEHAKQLANDKSAIYLMHSWEEKIWFVAFLVVIRFLRKWCMIIKYLKNEVKMFCKKFSWNTWNVLYSIKGHFCMKLEISFSDTWFVLLILEVSHLIWSSYNNLTVSLSIKNIWKLPNQFR